MADWLKRLVQRFAAEGMPLDVALRTWYRESGYWYTASALVHAIGFVLLAIVISALSGCPGILSLGGSQGNEAITLDAANVDEVPEGAVVHLHMGEASEDFTELSPENLMASQAAAQTEIYVDDSDKFVMPGGGRPSDRTGIELGGLGGFSVPNLPGPAGLGGVGTSEGVGTKPGFGEGLGEGLGGRGSGKRKAIAGATGATHEVDRAVAGALNWLARHQAPTGNWSLDHTKYCKGGQSCSGVGAPNLTASAAATAMALLAFQAAGETHKDRRGEKRNVGPYRHTVQKAITWLMKHQDPKTGNLAADDLRNTMYSHGLATIALCEACGMTQDESVRAAATKAVRFIELAQNEALGGWRYHPHSPDADTSVTAWQVMALKSAEMAGIGVNSMCYEGARRWLASVARGPHRGLYAYVPYGRNEVTPTMTAAATLCQQYMGTPPNDPSLMEGKQFLLENLPDPNLQRDVYYWYYATLVMHNFMGADWDRWNRPMRRALIATQCKEGCAEGSWDPEHPTVDRYSQAGRVYVTALSVLTLEVYYRQLPLYKINQGPAAPAPADKTNAAIGLPDAR